MFTTQKYGITKANNLEIHPHPITYLQDKRQFPIQFTDGAWATLANFFGNCRRVEDYGPTKSGFYYQQMWIARSFRR